MLAEKGVRKKVSEEKGVRNLFQNIAVSLGFCEKVPDTFSSPGNPQGSIPGFRVAKTVVAAERFII
jgi:hypothetical protein